MDTLLRETVNAVVNSRFPEMSIEGRRQIESILIREEFPKGAIALNEGEVAHEIVFVGKGMLRQYYYKNGKDVTEHFSYEGCITMCIESFLKQVPTRLIVETLEPSIIYLFPRDMIQKLARENWEINMFYQKILEYSLIVSQIKADSWRFESARERELVFVYKTVYDGDIHPSDELDGGRFWTLEEIKEHIGKGIFTPNFEGEFKRVSFDKL